VILALRQAFGREKVLERPIGSQTIGEAAQSNGMPARVDDEVEMKFNK